MIFKYLQIFLFSLISSFLISVILFLTTESSFFTNTKELLQTYIIIFLINLICTIILFRFLPLISSKNLMQLTSKKDQELIALKSAEKYRREFFGNVSHELKTPIFNIQGYVETLIDGAMHDKSVNKKYLKRTSKSVDRLIYIIKDLESITQLESEEIKLELTTWKLKNLINDIIEQFEIKAKEKQIRLIHKKSTTDVLVHGDKGKISQVLYNLISNSIKYGKKGGKTEISCEASNNTYLISVKDNGIGIAEKNIKRLFERFYRVDKSRSREQGGTGLGLAIVKHILEAHNQNISVTSSPKMGTEFRFSISMGS